MDIDKTIADLGTQLDAWFDGNIDIFDSQDRPAQVNALVRGVAIVNQLDRLAAQGLATLNELTNQRQTTSEDQRKASLVRGFEFGAKLAHALHDELLDTNGETKVAHSMRAIVNALDEMSTGRTPLATLLDHPDPGVRASAGAYLISLMPDRVVPILREIDQRNEGSSADFTAHWALLDWELKEKARRKEK